MNKTDILLITRNLPPLIGGMERLLLHCAEALSSKYNLTVIGPSGCRQHLSKRITVIEIDSALSKFLILAPITALNAARKKKYRLIIGGSGLTAPCLWLLQSTFKIPAISLIHGLDIVADSNLYRWLFLPALRRLSGIIANSTNTHKLCCDIGITPKKIHIIHPGCNTKDITPPITGNNNSAKLNLLYVGRLIPRKGLLKFLEQGFELLLQKEPNTKLTIIGDSPTDSISHQGSELKQLLELSQSNNWSDKINFLGKVNDTTLAEQFKQSDCLIFPLVPIQGDVEGFGMVAVEAAAHGTPTVAFSEGGVSDAIEDGVSGYLVESGDYKQLVTKIIATKLKKISAINCQNHANKFSWDKHSFQLTSYIESQLNK